MNYSKESLREQHQKCLEKIREAPEKNKAYWRREPKYVKKLLYGR